MLNFGGVHTQKKTTTQKTATHPMIRILTNPEPKSPSPTRAKLQAASSLHHQKKSTKNFIPVVYMKGYIPITSGLCGALPTPFGFLGYAGHYLPPLVFWVMRGITYPLSFHNKKIHQQTHRSLPASSTVIAWLWPRVTGVGRWVSLRPRPPGRCYVRFGECSFFFLGGGGWPWRCCL